LRERRGGLPLLEGRQRLGGRNIERTEGSDAVLGWDNVTIR